METTGVIGIMGIIRLHWDSGKENGNYRDYRDYRVSILGEWETKWNYWFRDRGCSRS